MLTLYYLIIKAEQYNGLLISRRKHHHIPTGNRTCLRSAALVGLAALSIIVSNEENIQSLHIVYNSSITKTST